MNSERQRLTYTVSINDGFFFSVLVTEILLTAAIDYKKRDTEIRSPTRLIFNPPIITISSVLIINISDISSM